MNIMAIRNWFLLLGQQWMRSLQVFFPANLKLFALVSVNAFLKASKIFFLYFWWLPLVYCLLPYVVIFGLGVNLTWFWHVLQLFFILLSIRSSIQLKTPNYFFSYLPHFIGFIGFVAGITFVQWIISFLPLNLLNSIILNILVKMVLFIFRTPEMFILASPLFLFFGFFYLDSDGTVSSFFNSCIRSLKMVLYAYPVCLIFLSVFLGLGSAFKFVFDALIIQYLPFILKYITTDITVFCVIDNMMMIVYHLFAASWFSTLYIKRAHEDYSLYFE